MGPFCYPFFYTLHKIGKIRGSPQELTIEEIIHILVCAAESAKHDTKTQENCQALQQSPGRPTPASPQ